MVITKTGLELLKVFLADPGMEYNIRGLSLKAKVNYKMAYQEVMALKEKEILFLKKQGSNNLCRINLSVNQILYFYVEGVRRDNFAKKHPELKVIMAELEKIITVYYSVILFGSYVKEQQRKTSDIDLLFIIPEGDEEEFKQQVKQVLKLLSYRIDVNVITERSVHELKKKDGINILAEVMKNHIILFGAEQYYRLIR